MREGIHTSVGKFFQKEDSGNICTRGHLLSRWALADKSWSPAAVGENLQKHTAKAGSLPGREPAKAHCSQHLPPLFRLRHPFLHFIHDCVESGIETIPQSPHSVPWLLSPCSSALLGLLVDSCFTEPRIPALCFSLPH